MADGRGGSDFFPPPSEPRRVQGGGIRAQTRRGRFGATWWSQRWLAIVNAFALDDRQARGRAYARRGQVATLDLEPGVVRATVQGTRREPYETRIELATLGQQEWATVARELAHASRYAARLLAAEMPDDVDAAFARVGLSLFPRGDDEVRVVCGCADWSPVCRHAVAASCLASEALDRDPLLLFRLRGIERDVLLPMIAGESARRDGVVTWQGSDVAGRSGTAAAGSDAAAVPVGEAPGGHPGEAAGAAAAALPTDVAAFWGAADDAPLAPLDLRPPPIDAPVTQRLGPPPLWQGTRDLVQFAEACCRRAQAAALDIALGTGRRRR